MAILALLGSTILLEKRYRPVIAVTEEIPWWREKDRRTLTIYCSLLYHCQIRGGAK